MSQVLDEVTLENKIINDYSKAGPSKVAEVLQTIHNSRENTQAKIERLLAAQTTQDSPLAFKDD